MENATKAEISVQGASMSEDMTSTANFYCSLVPKTDLEKITLFTAMNAPTGRVSDLINTIIEVSHVYAEMVNCTNEETGEIVVCPRVVIITPNGESFQCVSVGIYSAIKKLIQIFGEPTVWKTPKKMKVKQITKDKKSMLTLELVK